MPFSISPAAEEALSRCVRRCLGTQSGADGNPSVRTMQVGSPPPVDPARFLLILWDSMSPGESHGVR